LSQGCRQHRRCMLTEPREGDAALPVKFELVHRLGNCPDHEMFTLRLRQIHWSAFFRISKAQALKALLYSIRVAQYPSVHM
jgi:hypothetical protein